MKKFLAVLICAFMVCTLITACGDKTEKTPENTAAPEASADITQKEENKIMVEITMKDGGKMQLELYPDVAPATVENFVKLVNDGFYDGLTFHRIIKGFMIQGGDPEGTGMGGPGYHIYGEFRGNGFQNDLKHKRGVLSMARSMYPNSAGSQFFIMHEDAPHLDGQYAAFGAVTEGIEVVDQIAGTRTDRNDRPTEPQVMKKVTVETFGEEYPEPKKR